MLESSITLPPGGNEKNAVLRDDASWVHAAGGSGFSRLALYIREQDHESEKQNANKIGLTLFFLERFGDKMTSSQLDPDAPLRNQVNRSGFPFQLAVESVIRETEGTHKWRVVSSEFPCRLGFIDLVLSQGDLIATLECKKVEDQSWIFLAEEGQSQRINRCRLEWFKPASLRKVPSEAPIFASEFSMCEGSPESKFCVIPKGKGPIQTIESVCTELLSASHALLEPMDLKRPQNYQAVVPVLVTNAILKTCVYQPGELDIETGHLDKGMFSDTDFIRFRKPLVRDRSNFSATEPLELLNWSVDRERTVFIVHPKGLVRFLFGFRSFSFFNPQEQPL